MLFRALPSSVIVNSSSACSQRKHDPQKVSPFSATFISLSVILVFTGAIASSFGAWNWLDFLYYLSYLKLVISFYKFVPQAWMNFQRKSTLGWSIHNILLVSFSQLGASHITMK